MSSLLIMRFRQAFFTQGERKGFFRPRSEAQAQRDAHLSQRKPLGGRKINTREGEEASVVL